MAAFPAIGNCTPQAIPNPAIFGADIIGVEVHLAWDFVPAVYSSFWPNHGPPPDNVTVDFCNVTITHTHPGKNDTLRTQIWLPLKPEWNGRFTMAGGGGWSAGFGTSFSNMYGSVTEGYATATIDGGVQREDGASAQGWALTSPGNVNYNALQNFAFNGLVDGALIAKSVIKAFFNYAPKYSYWNGCSQGGRQGYIFAQRFPEIFDGIAAAAPAINWSPFFFAGTFPQQVFYELNITGLPHPCEFDALREAAVAACDGLDGLIDGLISDPEKCYVNPRTLVGTAVDCSATGGPSTISVTAAVIMEALWEGARTQNGSFLWYPVGYEAKGGSEEYPAILGSSCNNGTCTPQRSTLFTDWIKYFVEKNPTYDVDNMTREKWVDDFYAGEREYESILDTSFPDLSGFRRSGGKLLTWHGLADAAIPYGGTRDYFNRVAILDPNLRDFYRYFEAPGAYHCTDGQGGSPHQAFQALVDWVENDIAPETLVARNVDNKERALCLYPKKAVFRGDPLEYTARDFVCEE